MKHYFKIIALIFTALLCGCHSGELGTWGEITGLPPTSGSTQIIDNCLDVNTPLDLTSTPLPQALDCPSESHLIGAMKMDSVLNSRTLKTLENTIPDFKIPEGLTPTNPLFKDTVFVGCVYIPKEKGLEKINKNFLVMLNKPKGSNEKSFTENEKSFTEDKKSFTEGDFEEFKEIYYKLLISEKEKNDPFFKLNKNHEFVADTPCTRYEVTGSNENGEVGPDVTYTCYTPNVIDIAPKENKSMLEKAIKGEGQMKNNPAVVDAWERILSYADIKLAANFEPNDFPDDIKTLLPDFFVNQTPREGVFTFGLESNGSMLQLKFFADSEPVTSFLGCIDIDTIGIPKILEKMASIINAEINAEMTISHASWIGMEGGFENGDTLSAPQNKPEDMKASFFVIFTKGGDHPVKRIKMGHINNNDFQNIFNNNYVKVDVYGEKGFALPGYLLYLYTYDPDFKNKYVDSIDFQLVYEKDGKEVETNVLSLNLNWL